VLVVDVDPATVDDARHILPVLSLTAGAFSPEPPSTSLRSLGDSSRYSRPSWGLGPDPTKAAVDCLTPGRPPSRSMPCSGVTIRGCPPM
jgi:hypothetical protein